MVQPSTALAIGYGTLSAVSVSLGKGFQKYGVGILLKPRDMLRRENLFKLFMWCLGTAGIVASPFLVFAACAHGPVTLVAAFSGTGLVALALFSVFVLKEEIGKSEMAGMVAIVVGAALAGYFEKWAGISNYSLSATVGGQVNSRNLVLLSLSVVALSVVAAAYSLTHRYRFFGVIFGSISGLCGGISVFYQKGAMLRCGCEDIFADIPGALRNPFFALFAITGILDFLVTQFALTRSKAVTVIPAYQSLYMTVPIVGGLLAYHESVNLIQIAGLLMLMAGVFLLSAYVAGEKALATEASGAGR